MAYPDYSSSIHDQLVRFLGELGCSQAGLQFIESPERNRGIIRMNHTSVDPVRTGLAFVKKIKNSNVIVKSVTVSGVLQNARSPHKRRH